MTQNGILMTQTSRHNRVRERRTALGLTQAELAARAGISRTAVTAIEGNRLIPSVAAALALAEVLQTTVEALFGPNGQGVKQELWAWQPPASHPRYWLAEVFGQTFRYPATSSPMFTPLPDRAGAAFQAVSPQETLVLASCDPAAGLIASYFSQVTGMRLLVLPSSSRQAVEMMRQGLVHLSGLHLSTTDAPERNAEIVRKTLGTGYQMMRLARWQEGIASAPAVKLRSLRAAYLAKLAWIGREEGSGARECLDQLLEYRYCPRWTARNHRGVADAVLAGWADAGVCVQLVSAEAGLNFLSVREEAYDVCFPEALLDDRRFKALVRIVRSTTYRKLIEELPGYDASETGQLWRAD